MWYDNLASYEKTINSEFGEDGIIKAVFDNVNPNNKYFVDIGASDGATSSNTKCLRDAGWDGLLLDKSPIDRKLVKRVTLNKKNVCSTLKSYKVPKNFDFLSIDVDSNDFWILRAILKNYHPLLICFEFNPWFGPNEGKVCPYYPDMRKNNSILYGASLRAFVNLGKVNKYSFLHSIQNGKHKDKNKSREAGKNGFLISKKAIGDILSGSVKLCHPKGWKEPNKMYLGKETKYKGTKYRRDMKDIEEGKRPVKYPCKHIGKFLDTKDIL